MAVTDQPSTAILGLICAMGIHQNRKFGLNSLLDEAGHQIEEFQLRDQAKIHVDRLVE